MLEIDDRFKMDITLEYEGDQDLVVCSLENGCEIRLTPYQARILAGRLIAAVNRSEVKGNLTREGTLSRKLAVEPPASGISESSLDL